MNHSRRVYFVTISKTGSHIIKGSIKLQCKSFNFFYTYEMENLNRDFDFLYLTRKKTYEYVITQAYSYYLLDKVLHKDNLYNEEDVEFYFQKQLEYYNGNKITLTRKFVLDTLKQLELFYKFYSENPSNYPTLYYEDISLDAETELKKWNFEYFPEFSSLKKKKIPYEEVFANLYEHESFFYKLENKIKEQYKIHF